MPTILKIENLCFSRGKREILRDVSFIVQTGDFVSIVGKNGAGKTTLLKCLCNILPTDSGSIRLHEKALSAYSQKEIARQLSYLPQSDHEIPPFSVLEFVTMGRYPHLSPFSTLSAGDKRAVDLAMQRVEVSHLAERQLTTLSGGERQKAFIAAALSQGAEILILDEPASFLDPKHQLDVYCTLKQLNAEGITVIMVTHDLNGTASYANTVVALQDTAVAYFGPCKQFISPDILHRIFDVNFEIIPLKNDRVFITPEVNV